jgi:DNA-binding transcriptional MerR regulator
LFFPFSTSFYVVEWSLHLGVGSKSSFFFARGENFVEYSIGEFARATGLSAHTLRYYEKEELLAPKRGRGGQRYYLESDLRWLEFIRRLKETGMPIKEIRQYAALRAKGDSTLTARLEMLMAHRTHILHELAKWQSHLENMSQKIQYYENEIAKIAAATIGLPA